MLDGLPIPTKALLEPFSGKKTLKKKGAATQNTWREISQELFAFPGGNNENKTDSMDFSWKVCSLSLVFEFISPSVFAGLHNRAGWDVVETQEQKA